MYVVQSYLTIKTTENPIIIKTKTAKVILIAWRAVWELFWELSWVVLWAVVLEEAVVSEGAVVSEAWGQNIRVPSYIL